MRRKVFCRWAQGAFILAALTLVAASPADATPCAANTTCGELIVNTVYNTVNDSLYNSVSADIGGLTTAFPVDPAELVNTSNQDALTGLALSNLGLTLSQVINLLEQNIFSSTTSDLGTSVGVVETPDAVVVGDPACLSCDATGGVIVVQGTVTVTDTETTYQHQNYNLNITGDLAPQPVPEPPSLWLMAAGLAGIAAARRRQARRRGIDAADLERQLA